MQKLAVTDIFGLINNVAPVMKQLGPMACYYCSEKTVLAFPAEIKKMARSGVEIVVDNYEKVLNHSYLLADHWWSRYWESGPSASLDLWLKLREKRTRVIYYMHATDHSAPPPPESGMLYSSARQFFKGIGPGVYMKNQAEELAWGIHSDGGEGVVAGLIHLSGQFPNNKTKEELKFELAEKLGVSLASDLPLVVYFVPEKLVGAVADRGLEKLARYANVVIKAGECYQSFAEGDNIHFYQDSNWSPLLPRLAADVILSGYTSGSLTTNIMLGLKTIPVYTRYIDTMGMAGWKTSDHPGFDSNCYSNSEQRFISFCLQNTSNYNYILKYLSPLDIEGTDLLLERIYDKNYWNRYQAALGNIQEEFGLYYVEKASQIAAQHIRQFLKHGTFLTEEIATLNDCIEGEEPSVKTSCFSLL